MARTTQRKAKGDKIKLTLSKGSDKNKEKETGNRTAGSQQSTKETARRGLFKVTAKGKTSGAGGVSKKASLNMLAEVAAATLKRGSSKPNKQRYATRQKLVPQVVKKPQPIGDVPETTKDVMRRVSQGESLNLSQIQILSDKLILNVFAEFTSDEIRRSYTYSCYLMPDRCKQKFNSFGNETSARLLMKSHLLGHIEELLAEEKDQNKVRKKFIAEPIVTRKKRLEMEQKQIQKRKGVVAKKSPSPVKVGRGRPKAVESSPKKPSPAKSTCKPSIMRKSKHAELHENDMNIEERTDEIVPAIAIKQEPPDLPEEREEEEEEYEEETPEVEEIVVEEPIVDHEVHELEENTIIYVVQDEMMIDANGQLVKSNEPVIIENIDEAMLEGSSQPLHDHSYSYSNIIEESNQTSTQEVGVVEEQNEIEFSGDIGLDEVVIELGHDMDSSELERIATLAAQSASSPRQILQTIRSAVASSNIHSVFPTAHSKGRRKTSHAILASEEEFYAAEDELEDEKDLVPGSQDWERRMAMKYIRLLRTKKKDERIPLVCKICKDKTFTAQATLMYHYRSHAGIKPFTCTICNTSFTRQHSLNYHMLIHNNRSRFTCGDCGRKFRHPSHFKEHMRRHTGETPFECDDCDIRFKTRNTYKRHLKTRHGKLLTAAGIRALSEEEFNKVRTNPKRRVSTIPIFNRRRDMETQWPDPEHIGVEEADAVACGTITGENYGENSPIAVEVEEGDDQVDDDDDEANPIEVYGDPNRGQTIQVVTADGQLIDVRIVERKPEYSATEEEMDQENENAQSLVLQEGGEVTEAHIISGEDIQPILECINNGNLWE